MRKILFILLVALLASCQKEGIDTSLTLDKKSASVNYGDEVLIPVSTSGIGFDEIDFSVKDDFIATVHAHDPNFRVYAEHVGETYLIVKYKNKSDSCKITVLPTDGVINEPVVLFGSGKDVIKSKEKNILESEGETSLIYRIDQYNKIEYYFRNGSLYLIHKFTGTDHYNRVYNILKEMYEYVEDKDGKVYKKRELWIKLTRTQANGSSIYYSNSSSELTSFKNYF